MPPMNLPWYVFRRPIKPVALVLMNTMRILGWIGVNDNGVLGNSMWADVISAIAFSVAGIFVLGFIRISQRLAEWALIGAFFVWGIRFWAIILVNGFEVFTREGAWLALCWMLLAGGSWLLERSDPYVHDPNRRGSKWSRR